MVDYHPDQPPGPNDGPIFVDDFELEPVGHATQPPYVHDIPEDSNRVERTDLVEEARRLAGDKTVIDVLQSAGSEDD